MMAALKDVIPKMKISNRELVICSRKGFPDDICICVMPNILVISDVVCNRVKKEISDTGDCLFILDIKVHALLNNVDYHNIEYSNGDFFLTVQEFSSN